MGMSTRIIGFREPDDKWRAMKAVWDACVVAGVDPPRDVDQFFDGEGPSDAGIEVDISKSPACEPWIYIGRAGFDIDIAHLVRLHPNLTKIRFYNSW